MYCKQCGRALTEGALYCAACGAPVAAVEPQSGSGTGGGTPSGGYGPQTLQPPSAAAPPVASASPYGTSPYGTSPFAPAQPAPMTTAPFPVPEAAAVRYAGFWRRFWGLFVDRIALTALLFPVGLLFGFNMMRFVEESEMTFERIMSLIFGSVSMWLVRSFAEWVYFSAFQSSSRQATLGQMLLGLKVTGLDGRPIGFSRATGRYFASWISASLLLIGFIMGAFTQRKQTLHDMIAGTLVVRA